MKKEINERNIGTVLKLLKEEVKEFELPAVSHFNLDPFKVLISCILSLRTKDKVTIESSKRLFEKASSCKEMLTLKEDEIKKLIYPVGFYKRKSKQIVQILQILKENYNCSVPNKIEDLLKLPGVGRKTANLVLTEGFNLDGICVDTHVHRISNRIGFVSTKNPIETEFKLREKLNKKYWKEYNTILVAHGQNICLPISPLCSKCIVNKICPKINVTTHR